MTDSRAVRDVLQDPETPERTVVLLREVDVIKAFAEKNGLDTQGNYQTFVQLQDNQVVWFLTASRPLAFEPKLWNFPIVGGFPYLGWFNREDAVRFRAQLEADGWDVYTRPVRAYSTGGWFKDPIVSSMLSDGPNAFRSLANVVLHELVHANILIPDQAVFNESLASFVGDGMTEDYLAERFGPKSAELFWYRWEEARSREFGTRLHEAYQTLEQLYESDATDAQKQKKKDEVVDGLMEAFEFIRRPNNAFLIGFKTYNAGYEPFVALHKACDGDWPRFLAAVSSLDEDDFAEELQEDLAPVLEPLTRAGCRAPKAVASSE